MLRYHIACLDEDAASELESHPGHKIQCSTCAVSGMKSDPDSTE